MQMLVIVLRLAHVISAILWFGGLTMLVMFIVPTIDASGPVGQQFMQQLMRHTKVALYMPVLGLLTVLSGLSLYWRNASISAGAFGSSVPGMTYGTGGLAGIIALIVGIIMIGRQAGEMGRIGAAIGQSGGPPSSEQGQRMGILRARIETGNKVVWVLLLVAAAAMAVARYL
jgi:hypothetical protein